MARHLCLAGLFCIHAIHAMSADFVIEDETLLPVPRSVENSIRSQDGADYKDCHLVGKRIALSNNSAPIAYAVTSADGCYWGAAVGPIWVVIVSKNGVTQALNASGYSLTVGKNAQYGLRHIAISAGTAGWYSESLWKYDGAQYREVRKHHFTASDKAACRAQPKICPWEN